MTLEDFEQFFEPTHQGRMEAARAFSLFDWDKSGMVDRDQVSSLCTVSHITPQPSGDRPHESTTERGA